MPDLSAFSETRNTSNLLHPLVSLPENGSSHPNLEKNGEFRDCYRNLDYCTERNDSGITILGRNQKRFVRDALERRKNTDSICRLGIVGVGKTMEDHLKVWVEKKTKSGVPECECRLPFLVNAPRMVECCMCSKIIFSGEEAVCKVHGCCQAYHITCAKKIGFSNVKNFKCPQHHCFICKQKGYWRCIRCPMTAHSKCAPWPDKVIHSTNNFGRAVCWRHPTDWRLEKKHADPTSDIEEIFRRLPVPYFDEEFKIDSIRKDTMENKMVPAPYIHIRRNVYLVKKKRDDADVGIGCKGCNSAMCSEDCECRVQSISCSKACHCSELCTNRPFRKEKRIKVVQTQFCGWGVEAIEPIKKGEFVIEYIGEVIDDASCEARLWDMKYRGDQNFYMCEIRKDFTIDATFKGNAARFLNHSCQPNCKLEKWQVDGETRVGVFASQDIEVGEPLTYDYRFVLFGQKVECHCGASNCQGYLGSKRKVVQGNFVWGDKRKRSKLQ